MDNTYLYKERSLLSRKTRDGLEVNLFLAKRHSWRNRSLQENAPVLTEPTCLHVINNATLARTLSGVHCTLSWTHNVCPSPNVSMPTNILQLALFYALIISFLIFPPPLLRKFHYLFISIPRVVIKLTLFHNNVKMCFKFI